MKRVQNIMNKFIKGVLLPAVLMLVVFSAPAQIVSAQGQEKEPVPYTVKFGDTLSEIAASFDTSVDRLLQANPEVEDPDLIYIGQRITIPAADRPPRTALIAPTNGPVGSTVELQASGFDPYREVQILIGPEGSEAALTMNRQVNEEGRLNLTFDIPAYAEPGDVWIAAIRPMEDRDLYFEQSNTFAITGSSTPVGVEETLVYLVATGDNGRRGDRIGCNDSLVPTLVEIETNRDPVSATLEALLQINDRFYRDTDLYNSLHQSTLSVDRVDVAGGVAYVYMEGERQLGGVCDVPRFRYQIAETVNQFSSVNDAVVYLNGERLFAESDLAGEKDLRVYTVRPGDTLSHIAVSFDTTVEDMLALNPQIDEAAIIVVGQRFAIPDTDDDNPFATLRPTNGEPGTGVSLRAENLEPNTGYIVGIGRADSEYEPFEEVVADETGRATFELTIPEFAEADEYWVVVLESSETGEKIISNLFLVE